MYGIIHLAMANLRNRWKQSLAVGLSIAIAALLLATSLGLLDGMQEPFDQMFERQQASHILLFFDAGVHDAEVLRKWFEGQGEVAAVSSPTPFFTITGPLIFREREIEKMLQLTEWRESNLHQDQLVILEGEATHGPGPGEIWLPRHFARSNGIEVGDSLGVPVSDGLYRFRVSATIVDPHYSSGMINPNRAWVAPGELPFLFPIQDIRELMLGVRLHHPGTAETVWSRFNDQFLFSGRHFTYHFYKQVFLSFYRFAGAVLLVFSILGMIASVFLIAATLSGAIHRDFAVIGTLKALGYTPGNIKISLITQYLLLGMVSAPIGLAASYPALKTLLASLFQAIGNVEFSLSLAAPWAMTTVILLVVSGLSAWIVSGKAGRIQPAVAMRPGAALERQVNLRASRHSFSTFNPPLIRMALQFLVSGPGRAAATLVILLLTVFLLVLAVNLTHSFTAIKNNKPMWGFDESDVQVSLNQKVLLPFTYRQFMTLLEKEEDVNGISSFGYVSAKILGVNGRVQDELFGKAYASDLHAAGLINLEGKHPTANSEVALCVGTAQTFSKGPGDQIDFFIEGVRRSLTVTGVYQDVSNLGKGFRLHARTLEELNPLWEPDQFGIRVANGTSVPAFKDQLQHTYGEAVNVELSIDEQIETMGIIDNVRLSMTMFGLFFLLVFTIAIINDMALFIRSQEKELGIFKAVGYPPDTLRAALSFRIALLCLPALLAGIPLGLWLIPEMLGTLTTGIGLVEFPFRPSIMATLAIVPVILFTGMASAWVGSRKLKVLSPKVLMSS